MTQLSLLDVGAICLGAGLFGSWSGLFGALSWTGFALLVRAMYPRRRTQPPSGHIPPSWMDDERGGRWLVYADTMERD